MQRATCQKWQKLEIFYRKTEATSKRESVITNSNFKASYFTALKEIFTVWHTHKKDFRFLWVVCSLLTALSGVIFKIGFTTHPPGYLGWVSMAEHLHPSFKSPSTMQSVVDLRTGDKFSWVTTASGNAMGESGFGSCQENSSVWLYCAKSKVLVKGRL